MTCTQWQMRKETHQMNPAKLIMNLMRKSDQQLIRYALILDKLNSVLCSELLSRRCCHDWSMWCVESIWLGDWSSYAALNPIQEVSNLGVDAIEAWMGTSSTPGHYPSQEMCPLVRSSQGTAVISSTRLLVALKITSAERIIGDINATLSGAFCFRQEWDSKHAEYRGCAFRGLIAMNVASFSALAPSANDVEANDIQLRFGKLQSWQTDRNGVVWKCSWFTEPQKSQVAVSWCWIIALMDNYMRYRKGLLCAFCHVNIMVPW